MFINPFCKLSCSLTGQSGAFCFINNVMGILNFSRPLMLNFVPNLVSFKITRVVIFGRVLLMVFVRLLITIFHLLFLDMLIQFVGYFLLFSLLQQQGLKLLQFLWRKKRLMNMHAKNKTHTYYAMPKQRVIKNVSMKDFNFVSKNVKNYYSCKVNKAIIIKQKKTSLNK